MIKSRSDRDATSYNRALDKGQKNLQECWRAFFGGVTSEKVEEGSSLFLLPPFCLPLTRPHVYTRSVSLCSSLRRPTHLGRPLLSTWSTGPGGASSRAPVVGGLQASRVPTSLGPSDVRCPECAVTRRPLLYSISSIFSPLYRSSHAFHWFRSSLLFSILSSFLSFYFRTRGETGSPTQLSAAIFERLPDLSRDFIRLYDNAKKINV